MARQQRLGSTAGAAVQCAQHHQHPLALGCHSCAIVCCDMQCLGHSGWLYITRNGYVPIITEDVHLLSPPSLIVGLVCATCISRINLTVVLLIGTLESTLPGTHYS